MERFQPYLSLYPASDSQVPAGRVRAALYPARALCMITFLSCLHNIYPSRIKKGAEKIIFWSKKFK